jgi:hypothetical protein
MRIDAGQQKLAVYVLLLVREPRNAQRDSTYVDGLDSHENRSQHAMHNVIRSTYATTASQRAKFVRLNQ